MKQYAEHDRIGICHALRGDQMYFMTYSGGYPYLNNGVLLRSSSLEPIYSYGKNYEKNGKKFALFVWTTNADKVAIEKLFESSVKEVGEDKITEVSDNSSFSYLV